MIQRWAAEIVIEGGGCSDSMREKGRGGGKGWRERKGENMRGNVDGM